ncbi:hypothetical protein [Natronincola ferrireducens]|uniref:PilX N-terminal n=1 Tax=Natronincola ferrireducens TaxID=393762 RepID=A0A1G9CJJ2_9FIRM|nr:hypothetical protein [Natronincola ferrireducens]SDK51792.1 hypothetical protein SAMN05660472_01481 [Natronincola ferrireducens]
MEKGLTNKRGSIVVNVFIIGLIIFTLMISAVTLVANDYQRVASSSHSIKAYFLAESAMEEAYHEILILVDDVVVEYLEDLKEYKMDFINKMKEEEVHPNEYQPPQLGDYLQDRMLVNLAFYNKIVENPFHNYSPYHYYKRSFTYDSNHNTIVIEVVGVYNQARKFIRGEARLPIAYNKVKDRYNLPQVEVVSLEMISSYQTYGGYEDTSK